MAELGYLRGNGVELIICKQSTISYPLHNHVSVLTLGFVLDGVIELVTDGGAGVYQANDAFVILPYSPHCINAKSSYTLLSLCVSSGMLAGPEAEKAASGIATFLHDALGQPVMEAKISQALQGLIPVCRMMPAQEKTAVSGLKTQLEQHPERRYNVEDMAEAAFLSKYHLIRVFRREVGLTPHQFQIQNRIRKARKLLEQSVPAAEAALAAGFCDQSHFIRHFQKIVGLTPAGYRQACAIEAPRFAGYVSAGMNLANR